MSFEAADPAEESSRSLIDPKWIARPAKLSTGMNFSHWRFTLENFLSCVDPQFDQELQEVVVKEDPIPFEPATWPPETLRRVKMLYAILAGLLEARDLTALRLVPNRNGYEAWRLLVKQYEPKSEARHLVLLQKVMEAGVLQQATADGYEQAIMEWKELTKKYEEAAGVVLQDPVKKAVVVKYAPPELKQHLLLNADRYPSSDAILDAVHAYLLNRRGFDASGPAPMDVSAIGAWKGKDKGKGKGKDKDKGKGKDRDKGKGKDKGKGGKANYSCYLCQSPDHYARNCPSKGKGKHSGKNGKHGKGVNEIGVTSSPPVPSPPGLSSAPSEASASVMAIYAQDQPDRYDEQSLHDGPWIFAISVDGSNDKDDDDHTSKEHQAKGTTRAKSTTQAKTTTQAKGTTRAKSITQAKGTT